MSDMFNVLTVEQALSL